MSDDGRKYNEEVCVLDKEGLCYTFFFDRSILIGEYGSVFEEKYVNPVTLCRELDCFLIRPKDKAGLRMMTLIDEIVNYYKEEDFGYELRSRSALSELWLILLEETEEFRKKQKRPILQTARG